MNASAPGWQPDPSGRHEYRYWDGSTWTDDVSDAGLTSVDPAPGLAAPGGPASSGSAPAGEPTSVMDPTQGFAPTAAYGTPTPDGPGGYPPADAGAGPGGYGPTTGYPAYGSGPVPPAKPPRSGPSTGLLVGLGALALALIVAIVVVLTGDDGDGDETSTSDPTGSVTTESDTDTADTTVVDDTTDTSIDLGAGDVDFDDPEVRAAIVDVVADQLESSGFTREQAECFTDAMLDGLGPDRLAEIGESGGDMSSLTPEDMSSILDAVTDCGITNIPTAGDG
ncbi:MAG TPA: DUF2510 domain-containing protein [Acidimicrobiales bacterium]|nr:DUF2510 domain-containing protein [Acidimicrobiales bacterium]